MWYRFSFSRTPSTRSPSAVVIRTVRYRSEISAAGSSRAVRELFVGEAHSRVGHVRPQPAAIHAYRVARTTGTLGLEDLLAGGRVARPGLAGLARGFCETTARTGGFSKSRPPPSRGRACRYPGCRPRSGRTARHRNCPAHTSSEQAGRRDRSCLPCRGRRHSGSGTAACPRRNPRAIAWDWPRVSAPPTGPRGDPRERQGREGLAWRAGIKPTKCDGGQPTILSTILWQANDRRLRDWRCAAFPGQPDGGRSRSNQPRGLIRTPREACGSSQPLPPPLGRFLPFPRRRSLRIRRPGRSLQCAGSQGRACTRPLRRGRFSPG